MAVTLMRGIPGVLVSGWAVSCRRGFSTFPASFRHELLARSLQSAQFPLNGSCGTRAFSLSLRFLASQPSIPKTMKAARVVEFGKPLEFTEIPVPEPGYGQVLVKMTMSGVCHSDVHMRKGDLTVKPHLPIVPGHEGVGHVCKLGPNVNIVKIGDRVLCPCLCGACGGCPDCWEGWETACPNVELSGVTRDGTFSEYYLAWEHFVCPIPENVTDEEAAPINCAGVTSYKALKVSNARPGQWVIVIGAAGGLGFYALQYAKAMGFRVIAVDHGKGKTDYLQSRGFVAMDTSGGCIRDQVMKVTGSGAQVVMNLVPSGEISSNALGLLRKRGTLVNVGLMPDKMAFDPVPHVTMMTSIVGSLVGTRADLKEALDFLAVGAVESKPTMHSFAELNGLFDDLESGRITGRTVVRIP